MENKLTKVGRTTKGYWDSINKQGFDKQFPNSKFEIDKPSKFSELSEGDVLVLESLAEDFLEIKKQQTEMNGGKWIIW